MKRYWLALTSYLSANGDCGTAPLSVLPIMKKSIAAGSPIRNKYKYTQAKTVKENYISPNRGKNKHGQVIDTQVSH